MSIPEGNNGMPDLLDEARFGLEFAAADAGAARDSPTPAWRTRRCTATSGPAIPTMPHKDDIKRFLRPVSTAATLNLAAAAAQAARLWRSWTPRSRRAA